ncbi:MULTISPECIES: hypothetical protein [Pseudomonas]|uniref:Uncharacterized protein n=1 Tax=Pseudomonas parafulva TaxID=157782 RepID=A0AAJ0LJY2_9PSED|nr:MULTISPECIES: hypothetical protein [Pseudomonas]AQW69706.1 hypothetical protein B2J77_16425 [Pseudomonas parafulva]AUA34264.1 hypothetical protein CWR53_17515 [Pseudomonas sp. SGAir0191]KTS97510.1 hypothetical protein NS212_11245 [Pseudomonas parafulva]KTT17720.1 hypothetical protein NS96R_10810 [Pseudomonas parafulva]MBF8638883.1 hypothetical protein [Pseudomonas fulva]
MSEHTDPLADLSGSLGNDYDQSRTAQREHVIAELRQVIERVPEQSEFTNSRRYRVWGPVLLVGALILFGIGISMQRTGPIVATAFIVLIAAAVTWQHRNAGTQVFMRLTRRQLFVDTLDAPVDLAQVQDISVKDEGLVMVQTLEMSSDAVLPTHRVVKLQFFGNQAMVLKKPRPQVRIMSAGLAQNGRKLSNEEVLAVLTAYCDAAHAQRQLELLQANG